MASCYCRCPWVLIVPPLPGLLPLIALSLLDGLALQQLQHLIKYLALVVDILLQVLQLKSHLSEQIELGGLIGLLLGLRLHDRLAQLFHLLHTLMT